MTLDQINTRDYTYCSAVYHNPLRFKKFLVGTPVRADAAQRAHAYAVAQWGEPSLIHLYPRNYVKKARDLWAIGRCD